MLIGFDGSRSFVNNRTGTENYAFQLLKHLAKIDGENRYLIYLRPGNEVEKGEWPSNFEFKLLNFPRLWTQLGLAKQTFSDPLDVLFVPSHTLPLIRKPGLKTVMTVHDLGAEYLPGMHQLKQRLYLGLMTKIQLKTATKLIAVSNATKKDLVDKVGVKSERVEVVYEGLNEELAKSYNDYKSYNSYNHYDIDKQKKDTEKVSQNIDKLIRLYKSNYFLFVGTIQPRKNLERLIKAYAAFLNTQSSLRGTKQSQLTSDLDKNEDKPTKDRRLLHSVRNDVVLPKLILAGGKGWLSDEIYELPKKLGIERNVIFTGRVNDSELKQLYDNALAFTFPSLFEGFGLPVLEAFEAKIPVVTSNNSSLPEVAGDAAILVDPNKVEDIIEALLKMYNDKELRADLVKKGSEQLKKFSWEKCAKETLKVLDEV